MVLHRHKTAAFTLVEVLVSMGIAGIVTAALWSLLFLFSRSSATILNYSTINANDRKSLEIIGRDIREADSFVTLNATTISMLISNQSVGLSYTGGKLHRIAGGVDRILLPNCAAFQFKFFERNTNAANFESLLVSTSAACRVIEMNWSSILASNGTTVSSLSNSARFLNRRVQ